MHYGYGTTGPNQTSNMKSVVSIAKYGPYGLLQIVVHDICSRCGDVPVSHQTDLTVPFQPLKLLRT